MLPNNGRVHQIRHIKIRSYKKFSFLLRRITLDTKLIILCLKRITIETNIFIEIPCKSYRAEFQDTERV